MNYFKTKHRLSQCPIFLDNSPLDETPQSFHSLISLTFLTITHIIFKHLLILTVYASAGWGAWQSISSTGTEFFFTLALMAATFDKGQELFRC